MLPSATTVPTEGVAGKCCRPPTGLGWPRHRRYCVPAVPRGRGEASP